MKRLLAELKKALLQGLRYTLGLILPALKDWAENEIDSIKFKIRNKIL